MRVYRCDRHGTEIWIEREDPERRVYRFPPLPQGPHPFCALLTATHLGSGRVQARHPLTGDPLALSCDVTVREV